MATTITVAITVADDQAFTPLETRIIAAMQEHPSNGTPAVSAETPTASAAAVAAIEETAATKPATKRTRTPKAAPAPEAAESTTPAVLDTTLDEAPDLVGDTTPAPAKEYTLEDAVTAATEKINAGKQADVKEALAKAGGAKRVSELKGDAIGAFVAYLNPLAGDEDN